MSLYELFFLFSPVESAWDFLIFSGTLYILRSPVKVVKLTDN